MASRGIFSSGPPPMNSSVSPMNAALSAHAAGLRMTGLQPPLPPLAGGFSSRPMNNSPHQYHQIHETIESINQLKTQRDFMLSFSNSPQDFITDSLKSQSRDLKLMTDVAGNLEEERRAEFYEAAWVPEAVGRYVYSKVQQKRQELEQVLGIRLT